MLEFELLIWLSRIDAAVPCTGVELEDYKPIADATETLASRVVIITGP